MTLQSSGTISLADVRAELGLSGTISLDQSAVRSLAGVSSGSIALSNLYGKSYPLGVSITLSGSGNASRVATAVVTGGNGTETFSWFLSDYSDTSSVNDPAGNPVTFYRGSGNVATNPVTIYVTVSSGSRQASASTAF